MIHPVAGDLRDHNDRAVAVPAEGAHVRPSAYPTGACRRLYSHTPPRATPAPPIADAPARMTSTPASSTCSHWAVGAAAVPPESVSGGCCADAALAVNAHAPNASADAATIEILRFMTAPCHRRGGIAASFMVRADALPHIGPIASDRRRNLLREGRSTVLSGRVDVDGQAVGDVAGGCVG